MSGQPSPGFPPAATGWTAVTVLTGFYVLSFIDRTLLSLLVGPIQRDLQINDFQFGPLQGFAFSLLYVAAGLPIGRLVDRYPRRLIVCLGVTVWSAATALSGLVHGFVALMAARSAVAVGEATLTPAAHSMLSDLFPRDRLSTALGVFSMGAGRGGGIAFAVGGAIVSLLAGTSLIGLGWFGQVHNWQLAFIIVGLPGILFAFAIFAILEPRRRGKAVAPAPAATRGLLRAFAVEHRTLLLCHFAGFSILAMWGYAITSWAPAFYGRVFAMPPWAIGIGLAICVGVFGTIGTMSGGRLVDIAVRRGIADAHFRVPICLVLAAVPFGVAATLVPSAGVSFVLLAIMYVLLFSFPGPAVGTLQLIAPNELRGQMSAGYLFVVSIVGYGIGPVLVGALTDFWFGDPAKIGWSLALIAALCGPAGAAMLAVGLAPLRAAMQAADRRAAQEAQSARASHSISFRPNSMPTPSPSTACCAMNTPVIGIRPRRCGWSRVSTMCSRRSISGGPIPRRRAT